MEAMMKATAYLVIGPGRGYGNRATIRRVTQKRPQLDANEALIRVELVLPDDLFTAPLHTIEISKQQVEVAIEAEDVPEEVPA
jgi:hypothetical protein